MDVVVVGGGIAGMSVAHGLATSGARVNVTVLAPGSGHSRRAVGIVSAQFRDPDLSGLALRSQAMLRDLVPVHVCGLTQLALSAAAAESLDSLPTACDGLPGVLEKALAPAFRQRIVRAVFASEDLWLDAEATLLALGAGSRTVQGRALSVAPHRVDYAGGTLEGDAVVVARGPGGPLPRVGAPRRTLRRVLLARSRLALESMFRVVDTRVYGRPDSDGSLLGDGDRLFSGRDPGAAVRPDRAFLARMCGELSEMFGTHVGCTPAGGGVIEKSDDDRPFIERQEGVLVFGGLGAEGFALAPALGERIARALVEGSDITDLNDALVAGPDLAAALMSPNSDEPC